MASFLASVFYTSSIALCREKVNKQNETLDEIETVLYNDAEVMIMNNQWDSIKIEKIHAAVYVTPGTGKVVHRDRPYHGIVLNDPTSIKEYHFEDGRVMHTGGNALFYLPKDSSYVVKVIEPGGGCYAINFDADIIDEPFSVTPRGSEHLLHHFKMAASAWKTSECYAQNAAMRALYDAIYQAQKESSRSYFSSKQHALLSPALTCMQKEFTEGELTVSYLATLCGMSEVYFRRLFRGLYGVSPKEYIIARRMEYAKTLLRSESFSVAEIASLCGYAEPCHFSREFVRRMGVSPSRFIAEKSMG